MSDLSRSKVAPGRARNGFGAQVGASWLPSWPSWRPCWPSWTASWQPKTVQTLFGAVPALSSNACVRSTDGANARKTIFRRFRVVARKPRCASRTSFYSVLLASHEVSSARVHASRMCAKPPFSDSKTMPERLVRAKNRPDRALKCARSASGASENLFVRSNEAVRTSKTLQSGRRPSR